ncbi:MAG: hypothetical protein CBC25_03625 [Pelagibacteraceae bacterium TMED65]|nr:hypothetical protein [Rickettsiales bacterium]OUU52133.1 MAG: hypothetical protein CBC25_03625 [Pelagibacteraceae bacterium TMED65]
MSSKFKLLLLILSIVFFSLPTQPLSQDLDVDELLERLERIEKNISDIQKGKVEEFEKSLSSGYISRNESKLGDFETKIRANYGLLEEIENKVQNLDEKLNLIDKDLKAQIDSIKKIVNEVKSKKKESFRDSLSINQNGLILNNDDVAKKVEPQKKSKKKLNESEIKKKYENAIKLLWANKYEQAEKELTELKKIKPNDLMPNIQYWLGEVYYANKNFQQAIIEFGEGFSNYPDSIKGPDNLLKLGLSFSNLNKKNEACSAFYELEVKYKNSPKNVIERSQEERKKLNCPKE